MALALAFVLVVLVLFGVTLWAGVDAAFFPEHVWQSVGISRGVTVALVFFGCALGAAYYFALVRPRLRRAQQL